MKEPRKHHFLSKCYLKGFTSDGTEEGTVFAINLRTGKSFETNINDAGAKRDFNAVEGQPAGYIERQIAEIEGVIAPAIARIIQSKSIAQPDDWNAFLNLAAMFAVRNPRFRKTMNKFMADIFNGVMQLALATPERWASQVKQMQEAGWDKPEVPYEEMKRVLEEDVGHWKVSRGFHIEMEFAGSIEKVLKTLVHRNWTLMVAEGEVGNFITSDHPVCLSHTDGNTSSFQRPVGHAMTETTVLLPISKDLVAVGTFEGKVETVKATRVQVARLNSLIAQHSEDHIYASDDQFPIWLGSNYKAIGADIADFIKVKSKI